GVAMGARGSSASSEAADAVLTVDRLDRLGEVRTLARRTRRIAMQSVLAGMGMSVAAMVAAAAGLLPAGWGALLQAAIDVGVILKPLRGPCPAGPQARLTPADAALNSRFSREHMTIWADIEQLRTAADALGVVPAREAMIAVKRAHQLLVNEIGPHEKAEQEQLYPVMDRLLGSSHATAVMSRTHAEIAHQTRRLGQLIDDIGTAEPDAADTADLRALLYGLHAILRLHTTQEDESYLSLGDTQSASTSAPSPHPGTPVPGRGLPALPPWPAYRDPGNETRKGEVTTQEAAGPRGARPPGEGRRPMPPRRPSLGRATVVHSPARWGCEVVSWSPSPGDVATVGRIQGGDVTRALVVRRV